MMDDIQAIADAAISGAGIAWLPDWLIRQQIAEGKLAEIMQNVQNITFPVHVIWPQTPRLPLKIRLAVDKLVHQLPARLAFIAASSSERPKR
jgi:DNA-binding transcriptional LysR family regulator